jgi:hypothetical protein
MTIYNALVQMNANPLGNYFDVLGFNFQPVLGRYPVGTMVNRHSLVLISKNQLPNWYDLRGNCTNTCFVGT